MRHDLPMKTVARLWLFPLPRVALYRGFHVSYTQQRLCFRSDARWPYLIGRDHSHSGDFWLRHHPYHVRQTATWHPNRRRLPAPPGVEEPLQWQHDHPTRSGHWWDAGWNNRPLLALCSNIKLNHSCLVYPRLEVAVKSNMKRGKHRCMQIHALSHTHVHLKKGWGVAVAHWLDRVTDDW